MIIDLHAHIGEDVFFDEEMDEESLLRAYGEHEIDRGIVQPYLHNYSSQDYGKEAKRCIKITPNGHATHPLSKEAIHVWENYRHLKVPLMIHTGAGVTFSDPISVVPALKRFRDVLCVLAHAGLDMYNLQATYLVMKYDNVFLEPSWVGVLGIVGMVRRFGCGIIMFSSDSIFNCVLMVVQPIGIHG